MGRVYVKPSKRAKGYWRSTTGRKGRHHALKVARARVRQSQRVGMARRTVSPGTASVEMGNAFRRSRARGHKPSAADRRHGAIKPRRRSRRRRR